MSCDLPHPDPVVARYREAMAAWIADAFSPEGAFHSRTWQEFSAATVALKAVLRGLGPSAQVEHRGRTYRLDQNGLVITLLIPPPEEETSCPIQPPLCETSSVSGPPISRKSSRRRAGSTAGRTRF